MEQKQKLDHDKLHDIIAELMNEAASKTKQEVETLRKIYNANLEKLIEECSLLETVGWLFLIFEGSTISFILKTTRQKKRIETKRKLSWKKSSERKDRSRKKSNEYIVFEKIWF